MTVLLPKNSVLFFWQKMIMLSHHLLLYMTEKRYLEKNAAGTQKTAQIERDQEEGPGTGKMAAQSALIMKVT